MIKEVECVACSGSVSCGETTAKNFNTSNLWYHLQQVHITKFEQITTHKKAEEYKLKQQKTDACQLTFAEVKECEDLWNYVYPQHKQAG